ncbi:MAG: RidA family protein [Bacteroidetes bacterium]|nr:RidA family protein [Bacteroidota bacterium]
MKNLEYHSEALPEGRSSFHPHARVVGDFIYISGIIARKKGISEIPGVSYDGAGNVTGFDVVEQFEAIVDNLKILLEELDSSLENIIDITVFLTDIGRDFRKFNEVYGKHFAHIMPCRTTVEVTRFPSPVCIELKVIAIKQDQNEG